VAVRPQVKESNPDATFGDIAKIISTQFKALDEEERAKWDVKAAADKQRYQQEMEGVCIVVASLLSWLLLLRHCLLICVILSCPLAYNAN
jgi:hypothetical protein